MFKYETHPANEGTVNGKWQRGDNQHDKVQLCVIVSTPLIITLH
jgi:hypothetical protein